jgi:chromosome segregation ATPase
MPVFSSRHGRCGGGARLGRDRAGGGVEGEARVAYDLTSEFRRPVPLALASVAVIGWLLVAYFASQVSDVQNEMHDGLGRAEKASETMAADLQNLQRAAGNLADVERQVSDAKSALSEASVARAAAQSDFTSLTKQIAEARLAAAGANDEARTKAGDLEAVQDKLKEATDQLAAIGPKVDTATAERDKVVKALDDAKRALASVQQQSDALTKAIADAKSQLAELKQRDEAETKALEAAEAKLQATQKQLDDQQKQKTD